MNSEAISAINSNSLSATLAIAQTLGRRLKGGEVIELVGDLGAGKTAFVRGLARGIDSQDAVQSPSFTISRIYKGKSGSRRMDIHHYDFHRLEEPGVLTDQLAESLANPRVVTVVEWGGIVGGVLPVERLQITIQATGVDSRQFSFKTVGKKYQQLIKGLK